MKRGKNYITAGYNGARTVYTFYINPRIIRSSLFRFYFLLYAYENAIGTTYAFQKFQTLTFAHFFSPLKLEKVLVLPFCLFCLCFYRRLSQMQHPLFVSWCKKSFKEVSFFESNKVQSF